MNRRASSLEKKEAELNKRMDQHALLLQLGRV